MPMGLKLEESGRVIPGALDSHETEPSPGVRPHPLLLSNAVQARLGLTKSARNGRVTLDDFGGQSLEVAREKGTGLFMVRIDHLFTEQYQNLPLRALLLEQLDIPHLHEVESSEDEAHEELQKANEEKDELDSEEEDSQPEFEAWMKELQRQQSGLIVLNDEEAASQREFGALM